MMQNIIFDIISFLLIGPSLGDAIIAAKITLTTNPSAPISIVKMSKVFFLHNTNAGQISPIFPELSAIADLAVN